MKKIATFKLLGRKWTEVIDKDGCEEMSAYGYCDQKRRLIAFHPDIPDDMWSEVRYHEWTHAMSDTLAMGLTHEQVYAFGAAMHQITDTYRPLADRPSKASKPATEEPTKRKTSKKKT